MPYHGNFQRHQLVGERHSWGRRRDSLPAFDNQTSSRLLVRVGSRCRWYFLGSRCCRSLLVVVAFSLLASLESRHNRMDTHLFVAVAVVSLHQVCSGPAAWRMPPLLWLSWPPKFQAPSSWTGNCRWTVVDPVRTICTAPRCLESLAVVVSWTCQWLASGDVHHIPSSCGKW